MPTSPRVTRLQMLHDDRGNVIMQQAVGEFPHLRLETFADSRCGLMPICSNNVQGAVNAKLTAVRSVGFVNAVSGQ